MFFFFSRYGDERQEEPIEEDIQSGLGAAISMTSIIKSTR